MKIVERIATSRTGSEVAAVVSHHFEAVFKTVERVGSTAISAGDPKDYTCAEKAVVAIERSNDVWVVTVDHEVKLKAMWLLFNAGFIVVLLVLGQLAVALMPLLGMAFGPFFRTRWRGEKISKSLASAKVELEAKTESCVHSSVMALERSCPSCAETIKAKAILCRFCGREVEAVLVATATPAQSNSILKTETSPQPPTPAQSNLHLKVEAIQLRSTQGTKSLSATETPHGSGKKAEDSVDLDKLWEKMMGFFGRGGPR